MLAYRLRHRITIQTPTEAQDADSGEMIKTYADLYARYPAEVLTGAGRKSMNSGTEQNDYDCRINIRWFNITYANLLDCRIIWEGRVYEIISAEMDATARREWRLMCKGGEQVYQAAPITATAVRFIQEPVNGVVDQAFSPVITAEIVNADGNRINTTADIVLSIATGTGALTGTTTVACVGGLATFTGLSIDSAGTFTLTAASTGLTSDTSAAFSMTAAAGNRVRFVQQPTATNGLVAFSPVVTAEIVDGNGERVNTTDAITISIASGTGGTLSGLTTAACVAGLATFTGLTLASNDSGNFTLVAFSDEIRADISESFTVTAWQPSDLSGLVAWFDPTDLSKMFQDTAGAQPVTESGQFNGRHLDSSGNGVTVASSVDANRPNYLESNGYQWLTFDGITDCHFSLANFNLTSTNAVTICLGVTPNSNATQAIIEHSGTPQSNTGTFGIEREAAGSYVLKNRGSIAYDANTEARSAVTPVSMANTIIAIAPINDFSRLIVDGVETTAVSSAKGVGNFSSRILNIGARNNNQLRFNGRFHANFIYNRVLTSDEIALAQAYINARKP